MKRLFIEPLDVLIFRCERPFTARESHVAKLGEIFSLSTFEGAIKSAIFLKFCKGKGYSPSEFQRRKGENENENDFKNRVRNVANKDPELKEVLEVIGHPAVGGESSIQILGVFFSEKDKNEELFPVPNDIVEMEGDKNKSDFLKLNPVLRDELKIPGTEKYACLSIYSKIKERKCWMSFDALTEYLWGNTPDKLQIKNPYDKELRTGIRLEKKTKTTVEDHLYTAEFLRLRENWGFIVWYEVKERYAEFVVKWLESDKIIRLGGEGRGAICRKIPSIDIAERLKLTELVEKINEEGRFKLYLATPSHFRGYKPPKDLLEKQLGVRNIKLRAALPGKPVYIGGYDFAMNLEKPLQRWVNAGAVYYYEFEGEIKDLILPIKIDGDNNMRCAFIGRW